MIEIVQAVATKTYDLEAAIALVMDRFGLTYEEAKKQLGTPQLTKEGAAEQGITQPLNTV